MKLGPDQLLEQLAATPPRALAPVYLVSGDEPLLVNEALDAIRAAAATRGAERESWTADRRFGWDAVTASLASLSLFGAAKLVEIRLPAATPGDEGSRELRRLAARPADGNTIVVITPALTRKVAASAWAGALAAAGVWVEARAPGPAELPRWIGQRLRLAGLSCDAEGLQVLAARVEGNLLAAQQEIDKLALLHPAGGALTLAEVRAAVADDARFDVFQLGDAALAGDAGRAVRVLAGLREEGTAAPLVLWCLVRESLLLVDAGVRASRAGSPQKAIHAAGIWQSRSELFARALRNHRPGTLRRLLRMTAQADRIVKGARPGEPWNALLELTLALAGRPLPGAELS